MWKTVRNGRPGCRVEIPVCGGIEALDGVTKPTMRVTGHTVEQQALLGLWGLCPSYSRCEEEPSRP